MHLAFLTPEYPHPLSPTSGGIGTSIKNLAIALNERGCEITVFIYGQKQTKIFQEAGVNFHFIKQRDYKFFGWYLHRKHLQKYLNKYIRQAKIDAIEAPDWTGITAFMKLKCPLIIRFHGSDTYFCYLEERQQKKKNYWFERKALTGADHLLSVSQFTAKTTSQIFKLKRAITVIPNCINIENFKPVEQTLMEDTVLYFGSVIRKKGVLELAEILNLLVKEKKNICLLIAGQNVIDHKTGRSTKDLFNEKLNPDAWKQVIWLGAVNYEEVKKQLAKAAVVVLPSFAEALPMTWIEAMAMEKPLVTSNIGWARELMIDGKTGFTVNPKDHSSYSNKILYLLNNPEKATVFGKAARNKIEEHFSTEVVVDQNIQFYAKIIS